MQTWQSGFPLQKATDDPVDHTALEVALEMRSTCVTMTFRSAFRLPGYDAPFPQGTYEVLSEDERLDGLSFEAFRRVSTFLHISGRDGSRGKTELLPVSQQDLDAAFLADQAGQSAQIADTGLPRKEQTR